MIHQELVTSKYNLTVKIQLVRYEHHCEPINQTHFPFSDYFVVARNFIQYNETILNPGTAFTRDLQDKDFHYPAGIR